MKFRVHFEVIGFKDSFEIEGDDMLDIQAYCVDQLERRGATYLYSEEI